MPQASSNAALRQPLLAGNQNAAAAGGAKPRAASSSATSPGKVKVSTTDLTCGVRVPGVSKLLTLPKDESELPSLLEKQVTGEKSVAVELKADVSVTGGKSSDVANATTAIAHTFRQLTQNLEAIGEAAEHGHEAARLVLAQQFHEHVAHALKAPRGSLSRRDSVKAVMANFNSAKDALDQGVEGYVKAVRKALKTDLDDSVRVSFRNLSFVSKIPEMGTLEAPYRTIGTTLYDCAIAPLVFLYRSLRNMCMMSPLIKYRERVVLSDLTGLIEPGRLTLVIGPPGCGKTTFLKALSGKLYQVGNPNAELRGQLKFNDFNVSALKNIAAWVSYVRQTDEHQPLLTTRETLDFAYQCRKAPRYQNDFLLSRVRESSGDEAVEKIQALSDIEVDISLAVLGLGGKVAETIIGDDNIKGVSGGEKRRVTLGEMLVTGSAVMCCDEISTGLDSAATFDITRFLGLAAHVLGQAVVVALLQPAPEVLDLFDDIIVMAEGQIIYHGPREQIQAYFEGLGFRVPEHKDLGDFIVELPTRNGREFALEDEELRELGLPRVPVTANEFAQRWKQSEMFAQESRELDRLAAAGVQSSHNTLNFDDMPQNGFFRQLWLVMKWSMTLRLRAHEQIIARLLANAVVGLFFGTLFWDLQLDDWWLKAMLFAMALMFLISTAFPTVQVISKQKPIFFKHIDSGFYTPTTFTLAQFVVGLPFVAFDVLFFATTMYWMCGLARHAENYLIFLVICTAFGIASNTMMTMFPFITPDQDTAIVLAALVLILMIVASGAISTESMIPPVFRWMIWANPLAYAYRALAINEYHSGDYEMRPCKFNILGIPLLVPDVCSHYFLTVREVRDDDDWIYWGFIFQVGSTLFFLACMIFATKYIRFDQQRVGAVAVPPHVGLVKGGKPGRRVAPATEDEIRNYQQEAYLNAVSPSTRVLLSAPTSANGGVHSLARGVSVGGLPMDHANGGANSILMDKKTVVVRDLTYTLPADGEKEEIDILKGVSFWAKPGRLTALMGSSGAGKTTLLDVIAGRKTVGKAKGYIMVNGELKVQSEFTKYTGYVEQFGIHAGAATVQESLEFSAGLRLPATTTAKAREEFVRETLELLELTDIKDALAGTLSMEQNKRLTLGVELIANPSIVLCDEPTSGLDARAAAIVMRILLKVARSGRTVIATIHQPSSAVFSFFDDLLLLKRGGMVVFFGELGPGAMNMVNHLEAIPGSKKFVKGSNPATYMLDCIGAGTGADASAEAARAHVDYAHAYEVSDLKRANDRALVTDFPPIPQNAVDDPNAASRVKSEQPLFVRDFWTQLYWLTERNWRTYYRAPEFSLNRIAVICLFTALFAGFFWRSKMDNIADVEGRIVLVFFFSTLSALYSLYTLVPFAMSRRALYYRERASNTYSVAAYTWAEGIIEVPYLIIQVVLTLPLLYYVTNLPYDSWERPLYFTAVVVMLLLLMISLAFFMASMFSDPLAAQLAAIGFLLTMMVFCGIMVPKQDMPVPYLPMYYFSFFKYSSEGLLTTQFHDLDAEICVPAGIAVKTGFMKKLICTYDGSTKISQISGIQVSASKFVLEDFAQDYKYENRWMDLGVLGAWVVLLRLITYFITLNVNHQKR